jgi:hypothetical protein
VLARHRPQDQENGGKKAKVASAKRWPSTDQAPNGINPHVLFNLSTFDLNTCNGLSD